MHGMHHGHEHHGHHGYHWQARQWRGGWGPRPWMPMLIGFGLLLLIFGKLGFWIIPLAIGAFFWFGGAARCTGKDWSRASWMAQGSEKPKRDFVEEDEKPKRDDYV